MTPTRWVLPDADGDRSRSLDLARRARDAYRESSEVDTDALAEVERWLTEHKARP